MTPSSGDVHVELLQSIEGEEVLRGEWDQLVSQMEVPQIFFTYEWALAVERAFAPLIQLRIFVLKQKHKTIGIAALACCSDEPQKVFFLTASTGDYCDIVSAPQDRGVVVAALLGSLRERGVREIDLTSVPSESFTVKAISQLGKTGYRSSSRVAYICGRIVFNAEKRLHESNHALPEISLRRVKDEKMRRLSKLGPIKLVHVHEREKASRALDEIIKAQVSRFLATSRLSPLLAPARRRFLAELTNLLGPKHWLDVSVLKIAERDVAWNFGFRFHGVHFWYLPTFDFSLESFSPGLCLLRLLMEESSYTSEIKEIDLGLGDENYKARVANDSRKTLTISFSADLATHWKTGTARALARGVKAWRPAEHVVRSGLRIGIGVKNAVARKRVMNTLKIFVGKMFSKVFLTEEIALYELPVNSTMTLRYLSRDYRLEQMTWNDLAKTALLHCDDSDTLEYLKRSARRLRNSKGTSSQGYVLLSETGEGLHYLWTTDFSGFRLSEIDHSLGRLANASMIFDCWTPKRFRGMRHYRIAIEYLGRELRRQDKSAWIFSAKRNLSSLRALQKSRFEHRYSLSRRKFVYRMPVERIGVIDTKSCSS